MAGMRKEYDPNKGSRRKRRPIIYIICEGKETETNAPPSALYFHHQKFLFVLSLHLHFSQLQITMLQNFLYDISQVS